MIDALNPCEYRIRFRPPTGGNYLDSYRRQPAHRPTEPPAPVPL